MTLDTQGARRAVFNANTPITAQVTTNTTRDRRAASQGLPHTYDEIQEVKAKNPDAAALMEMDNLLYQIDHPAAAVNRKAKLSKQDTQDPRLTTFEKENAYLRDHAPRAYTTKLATFKQSIGLR
jgi:hypothetical protein